jgi:hypothetical protein
VINLVGSGYLYVCPILFLLVSVHFLIVLLHLGVLLGA